MLVSDLLAYSLRISGILGVGQVALAQDTADALTALSMMLTQWQAKRWLVFRTEEHQCPVVAGTQDYTIGPGGNINTGTARRPTDIEAAFIRQLFAPSGPNSLAVDYPLARIDSIQEWSRGALKNLHSWPSSYYYDPTIPLGTFTLWPIPLQSYFELHVFTKPDISAWVQPNADTDTIFPAETQEALVYNLVARLRVMYRLPPDPDMNALADIALRTMRSTNLRIQKLGMPAALSRGGRVKNPMGGFVETAASIPFSVVGP